MAYSIVQFVGDGTSTTYSFPFPYIDSSHIEVKVSGVPVGFSFANTNTVTLDAPAASGALISISRNTPKSAVPVDFSDGSILREADLDVLAVFSTYVAQETYDRADDALGYDSSDGKWDAVSRVIKNVGNPVNAGDAVNKGTIDSLYPYVATVAGSITNVNTVGAAGANVNTVAGNIASVNTVAGNTANVSKVAAVDAKVTTVANNDANVTTVAGSITSVNTTAAAIANVNTTAGSIGNVGTVATNIANVNAVAGNNTNITAVAGNAANINSAVANSSNINAAVANAANISTVAGNTTNVTKVAAIDTKVTTVANNDANVSTVAGISGNVTTVAGIAANVTTVANNNANVTSVANNSANINAAVGNAANINAAVSNTTNINAVVANAANINTVAGVNADVTTVATNIAAVLDAPNQAAGAAASAVSAASSAATAAALLDNFDDRYLGAKASDPATDNDGNALIVGALYFNTTDGVMSIYTSSGWIAASSASVATLATFEFVATAGQTVFSGADANGVSLSYTAPAIMVTLNGVRLRPDGDYTATDGVNITLVSAATAGDELVVDAFGNFLVADTYSKAQTDALIGAVDLTSRVAKAGDTMTGSLGIRGTSDGRFGTGISLKGATPELHLKRDDGNGEAGILLDNASGTKRLYVGTYNSDEETHIGTNGMQRLIIDSAGRVRMPYQPAFHAKVASVYNATSDSVGLFQSVLVNRGGCYNSSNSTFTAPTAGVYVFGALLRVNASMGYAYCDAILNGARIYNTHGLSGLQTGTGSGFTMGGGTFMLNLAANDTVKLNVAWESAGPQNIDSQTFWYGYLIG